MAGVQHGATSLEVERRHLRALVEIGQLLTTDFQFAFRLEEADLRLEAERSFPEDRFARRQPSLGEVIAEIDNCDQEKRARGGADGQQVSRYAPGPRPL